MIKYFSVNINKMSFSRACNATDSMKNGYVLSLEYHVKMKVELMSTLSGIFCSRVYKYGFKNINIHVSTGNEMIGADL